MISSTHISGSIVPQGWSLRRFDSIHDMSSRLTRCSISTRSRLQMDDGGLSCFSHRFIISTHMSRGFLSFVRRALFSLQVGGFLWRIGISSIRRNTVPRIREMGTSRSRSEPLRDTIMAFLFRSFLGFFLRLDIEWPSIESSMAGEIYSRFWNYKKSRKKFWQLHLFSYNPPIL